MTKKAQNKTLKVKLFNVGQGDHILLELPNGEFGIIDSFYDNDLGWYEIPALSYLKSLKRSKIIISFICISHPDYDHTKGLNKFLKWIREENILLRQIWMFSGESLSEVLTDYGEALRSISDSFENSNESRKDQLNQITDRAIRITKELRELRDFEKKHKERVKYIENISQLFEIQNNMRFISIGPLSRHIKEFNKQARRDAYKFLLTGDKKQYADKNLLSSILLIIWENHRLLFGGDTGRKIWLECLKEYKETKNEKLLGKINSNFIKASHHGSKNSSSIQLWEEILLPLRDNIIGISAGRRKNYKHPNAETIKHIKKATSRLKINTKIFSTNICNDCQALQNLPRIDIDWLQKDQEKIKEQTKTANTLNRAKNYTSTISGFFGYEFQFDLSNNNILINKICTNPFDGVSTCIYQTNSKHHFPNCAL